MTIHFDDKGKFYTNIIAKDPIDATIQTTTHRIDGNVYVARGERLIDELRASGKFIAVTNARVLNLNGEEEINVEFLTINRDHVIWVVPHEDKTVEPSESGGQT